PTLTVTFPVTGNAPEELSDAAFLAWTTTPWTLPSNLALAVHPEVDYALVRVGGDSEFTGQKFVLAEALVGSYAKDLVEYHAAIKTCKGTELEGISYEPIFDYLKDQPNSFQVLLADYVTTEDGTGVVPQAPRFG